MKKRTGILMSSLFVLGISLLLVNNSNSGEQVVRDKSIIVELKDVNGTDVESRTEVAKAFKRQLQSVVGLNYRITADIKHVSNILFIDVNSNDVSKIESLSLVSNVKESKSYEISLSEEADTYSYNSYDEKVVPDKNYSAESMNIDEDSKDGENTFIAILDDSFVINHEAFNDLSGTSVRYSKSDIEKLKSTSGFFAKSAGYKNSKVPFYYSYGTKNLDLTYKDNSTYHGQHVAGIAGGNGNKYKGISPKAQIALMKVTNSKGSFTSEDESETSDSVVLNALNDCSILDVDAINMSFGIGLLDFGQDDLYQSVFKKLADKGISINYAAGNDGREQYTYQPIQNLTTSSSETSILGGTLVNDHTMSIASISNESDAVIPSMVSTYSGTTIRLRDQIVDHEYSDGSTTQVQKYDKMMPFYSFVKDGEDKAVLDYVVVPNYGVEEDYEGIDVNGKIALVQRGGSTGDDDPNVNLYTFVAKVRNAVKHGAVGVIIYNNEGASNQVGYFALNSESDSLEQKYYVPMGYINSSDGELLKNQEVKKIVVSKDYASDFTSDGSTATLQLKPEVAAPGTNIYSSVGPNNDSYGYMSGTSMAAPNYTGAFANILSNYDISNNSKREETRKKLTLKIMSTADPKEQSNGALYSPRLLGAGEIDASGAYNSDVYLEGNVENRAKIELKNNDDIKKGDVKLEVKTYNESSSAKQYKVELYIQAPELTGMDTTSGSKFKGYKFQTSRDVLLNKVEVGNVTIPAGESSVSINGSVTEANKKYLDENFENGTYLEGYAVFTSLDGGEDLSIPYMGFYGDYAKESAVEPFNFEKEDGKIYGSDLLNAELRNSLSKPNADYSSMWVSLTKDLSTANYTNISANKASFNTYGTEVTYDSEKNQIILGQNGKARKFVIQQFVNRSVLSSKVEMISQTDGKSVLAPIDDPDSVDHMFSFNFTESGDKSGKLYKTRIFSNLYNNDVYADRAYSYFDFDNKEQFPSGVSDGLYDFIFTYTLIDGTVQTLKYTVNVTNQTYSSNISIDSQSVATIDEEKYLVYRFSGDGIKKFKVNNVLYNIDKDDKGYYVKVKLTDLGSSTSAYAVLTDRYGFTDTALLSLGDGGYSVISEGLSETDTINVTITESLSIKGGYIYTFDVKNSSNKSITLGDEILVGFDPLEGKSTDGMKVYSMDKKGKTTEVEYEVVNGKVIAKATSTGKIVVVYGASSSSDSMPISTLFIIIGCSILAGILITAGLILMINRKLRRK